MNGRQRETQQSVNAKLRVFWAYPVKQLGVLQVVEAAGSTPAPFTKQEAG